MSTPRDTRTKSESVERVHARARKLEAVVGDRFPALIPWLPAIGVVIGVAAGGVVWLVFGRHIVILREALLGVSALAGLAYGRLSRTRAYSWVDEKAKRLEAKVGDPPDEIAAPDLPAEFRGAVRSSRDPRDDVLGRRGPR